MMRHEEKEVIINLSEIKKGNGMVIDRYLIFKDENNDVHCHIVPSENLDEDISKIKEEYNIKMIKRKDGWCKGDVDVMIRSIENYIEHLYNTKEMVKDRYQWLISKLREVKKVVGSNKQKNYILHQSKK